MYMCNHGVWEIYVCDMQIQQLLEITHHMTTKENNSTSQMGLRNVYAHTHTHTYTHMYSHIYSHTHNIHNCHVNAHHHHPNYTHTHKHTHTHTHTHTLKCTQPGIPNVLLSPGCCSRGESTLERQIVVALPE